MRENHILLCFISILHISFSLPAQAQDTDLPGKPTDTSTLATKTKTLQQVIEEQQKQLNAQQSQIDAQNDNLQRFRQQLHDFDDEDKNLNTSHTDNDIHPRRNDLQTDRRDDDQSGKNWQGSFAVEGTDTRIKIGGFLELDVIHDGSAIASKGQFIPTSIPSRNGTKKDGADGQTNFSVSPSRFYIETRTPNQHQQIKTFFSIDMYGNELGVDPELRMRQGYVEVSNSLLGGKLLIGQAWSTTMDLEGTPDVLDFRGVDNMFGNLKPQIRWTRNIAHGINFMLAAETPSNHIIEGADSLTRFPDGVIASTWDSDAFNLMISFIATDLRASPNNGPVVSAIGYGGSFSGKIKIPLSTYTDEFMFALSFSYGAGSQYQNAHADAVYDPVNADLDLISNYGVTLAYAHHWTGHLKSTITYCCIEIDNQEAQAPTALKDTEYSSGNLVWSANERWLLGIEGISGKRSDNDGEVGTNFRTQLTSRLRF